MTGQHTIDCEHDAPELGVISKQRPAIKSGPLSDLRSARLSVSYEDGDPKAVETLTEMARGSVARLALAVAFPISRPLPDLLLRVLEAGESLPLDVLVVAQDTTAAIEIIPQQIGQLLQGLRNRKSVSFCSVPGNASALGICEGTELVLLLQEVEPNAAVVALSARLDQSGRVNVCWSWGDPLKRARTLIDCFRTLSMGATARPFSPCWDGLGLETDGYSLPPLYRHQVVALEAWAENEFQGIFEMCTGAGKTVAALAGSLLLNQRLKLRNETLSGVVILCPKRVLVEQWQSQLLAKGFKVSALVYDNPHNYLEQLDTALRDTKPRYVISTYESFALPRFQSLIRSAAAAGRRGLLIADEMHWCASADRRACLRSGADYFSWRLGLSATPEIEDDEVATKQLLEYFGGILAKARYGLEEALRDDVLCPYVYLPVPAFLDSKTSAKYFDILRRTSARTEKTDLAAYSERRRILRKGEMQIQALETICDQIRNSGTTFHHTLVYCPPGQDFDDVPENDEETNPLINKIKRVFQNREILCTSILAETTGRDEALKQFENATVSILLAIGCLDEGMDVPCTRRAIMLYSVDRLRQFVQRRGRVLRKHPGKDHAEIIDLIVLPHNADVPESIANDLLRRELRRYTEFARLARNGKEAQLVLENAIQTATSRKK